MVIIRNVKLLIRLVTSFVLHVLCRETLASFLACKLLLRYFCVSCDSKCHAKMHSFSFVITM